MAIITELIGSKPEALRAHQDALRLRQTLAFEHPTVIEYQQKLAKSHDNIGDLLRVTSGAAEAEHSHQEAVKILEVLVRDNPDTVTLRQDLARSYNNLGVVQKRTGHYADAEQSRSPFQRASRAIVPALGSSGDHRRLSRPWPRTTPTLAT